MADPLKNRILYLREFPAGSKTYFLCTISRKASRRMDHIDPYAKPYLRDDGFLHHNGPTYYHRVEVARLVAEAAGFTVVEDYA